MRSFKVDSDSCVVSSSSSKGNQIKWHKGKYWLKQDYLGYEALAEVLSALVCSCISNIRYVDYNFCSVEYKGVTYTNCCYSRDMLKADEELTTLGRIVEGSDFDIEQLKKLSVADGIKLLCSYIYKLRGLDITTYVCKMLLLDSLILNEDRHIYNIGLIRTGSGGNKIPPVFDNGGALLSDTRDYPLITDTLINMRNVRSKPFSSSFSKQVKGALGLHNEPLIVDYSLLSDKLNKFNTNLYSTELVDRCKKVLNSRFNQLEGTVWIRM